jgi:hypothetical protein
MNVLLEGQKVLTVPPIKNNAIEKALLALCDSQSDGRFNPRMFGGILENGSGHKLSVQKGNKSYVCARSSCYSLIVLPKLVAGSGDYLKT